MDAAKNAIKDFTSKHGKHDTTVHEQHAPAVTHEHTSPTVHHEERTAVDREVHQHHHHTSVQPIHDREVLPEQHHHELKPVEHTEHRHGNHEGVKERLAAEASQFKDVHEVGKEQHTQHTGAVQTGEHVHHHVHETIQPVIQKETIQPSVIHSTKPIHEVHHNEPIHHSATANPAISMDEFKRQGGSLTGGAERTDRFKGEPGTEAGEQHGHHGGIGQLKHGHGVETRAAGDTTTGIVRDSNTHGARDAGLATGAAGLGSGGHDTTGRGALGRDSGVGAGALGAGAGAGVGVGAGAGAGTDALRREQNVGSTVDPRIDSAGRSGVTGTGATNTTGLASHNDNKLRKDAQFADTHAGSTMDRDGAAGNITSPHSGTAPSSTVATDTATSPKKPGIMDRLNPLKDSDGDGKKGVMK